MPLPDEEGRHAILVLHAARLAVEIELSSDEEQHKDEEKAAMRSDLKDDQEVIDLGPDLRPTRRNSEQQRGPASLGDPLRLREVAAKTVDFSGAELANLVNEAVC